MSTISQVSQHQQYQKWWTTRLVSQRIQQRPRDQIRGDLDKALEMYGKSLAIDEKLGRKQGMANQYGNMGIVYQIRADLDKAEEVWTMSLQLFEEIGANDKIELIQGWLAGLRK